jgi:hypothetical protein
MSGVDPADERTDVTTRLLEVRREGQGGRDVQRASRSDIERPRPESSSRRRWLLVLCLLGVALAAASLSAFPGDDPTGQVLVTLGAGVGFVSLLGYLLGPETRTGRDSELFSRLSYNEAAIISGLGLPSVHRYVPTGGEDPPVRLFVPRTTDGPTPDGSALREAFVDDPASGEFEGLAFDPAGLALLDVEMEGELPTSPTQLVDYLSGELVDRYELASEVRSNVDSVAGEATVTFVDTLYGPVTQFDHPLSSFVAVGLAIGLRIPVTVEPVDETRVRYHWDG